MEILRLGNAVMAKDIDDELADADLDAPLDFADLSSPGPPAAAFRRW
jgi:hypothetical protein